MWIIPRILGPLIPVFAFCWLVYLAAHDAGRVPNPSGEQYAWAIIPVVAVLVLTVIMIPFSIIFAIFSTADPSFVTMQFQMAGLLIFSVAVFFTKEICTAVHFLIIPHPIDPLLDKSRADPSHPLLADGMPSSLLQQPVGEIGLYNRTIKAERMTEKIKKETQYLDAEAKLAGAVEEMERARARLDEMKKRRG